MAPTRAGPGLFVVCLTLKESDFPGITSNFECDVYKLERAYLKKTSWLTVR